MSKPKTRAEKILAKFHKARNKRQLKDSHWRELDTFDRGDQWEVVGHIPPWIPKPVTNMIHLVKTTKRAALAIENSTGKLRPLTPFDIEPVKKFQKVYEHVWSVTKSRSVVRDVIETGKLLGTGIAQVFWDENTGVLGGSQGLYEGEIRVRQLDPASVYPDPSAFRLDDCQFIHIVERKPIEWLKNHPLFKSGMEGVEERNVSKTDSGEIYERDYDATMESKNGIIDFHSHYEKVPSKEGGFNYKVTYLAGDKIVHTIEKLEPNCYPFAIYYDYPQRQDFWGKSTCGLILDNQKLINKVESIIALIGTQLQNPQKIVSKGSGINPEEVSRYGSAAGHTFVANGDVSKAIYWQPPPQIPAVLFNLAETAKQNIREITGLTEAYMGQTVGSLQTSSGVNSLIERSTMRDRDQMYDLELFIEDLSRIELKFASTKYTEPRFARVLNGKYGEDSVDDFMEFLGTDYADLEYSFFIDVSSKAPISRARQQEELDKLLNLQGQYQFQPPIITQQEYMEYQDYIDGEKLIERMKIDEMTNEVEQAMQVANMLTEAMQQGVPEEQLMEMATAMITQMNEQQKLGNVSSNSGQVQQHQQGVTF
jgi:hypothetical protein